MVSCKSSDLVVVSQVTGAETNCYLIFDSDSCVAALIDVGGPVNELLATLRTERLRLKYVLLTHGHIDHLLGVQEIRDCFPEAVLCMHGDDFSDLQTVGRWAAENVSEDIRAGMMADSELRKIVEFDVASFPKPDRFLEEGDMLELGAHGIRVIHSPGHSRGGLCYSVGDVLFSGDVLFRRSVGRVDLQTGSRDDQIASVRRLYRELPDCTVVYPGHGEPTTIGEERVGNSLISESAVAL
jgi:glyoxylase-like metal-dependent hydrolase (beta-lactamase superfamily II)